MPFSVEWLFEELMTHMNTMEPCSICKWQEMDLSHHVTECICDNLLELGVCLQCMYYECQCKKIQEYSDHCVCEVELGGACCEDNVFQVSVWTEY